MERPRPLLWPANRADGANAIAVDSSGNVVVTGSSVGGFGSYGNPTADFYTAKYAAAGSGKNATTARRAARTPPVQ